MSTAVISKSELKAALVDNLGLVEPAAFARAEAAANRLEIPLDIAVADQCHIPYRFLLEQIADACQVGFAELKISDVQENSLKLLPAEFARQHLVVPFHNTGTDLCVAMRNPRDERVRTEIARITRLKVRPFLAQETALRRALLLYHPELRQLLYHSTGADPLAAKAQRATTDEQSVATLVELLLEYAAVTEASDIHLEPYEREGIIRFQIDGVLREVVSFAPATMTSVVARIKVLSNMRLDEKRLPQDARFNTDLGGLRLDLRVSSFPTLWGEKIVCRVLNPEKNTVDVESLGLRDRSKEILLKNAARPHGMIIVTGPIGSGKTTTLYAVLTRIGTERQAIANISSIEDPIEYSIRRVNQMPINLQAGLDFATGLRALLRQDSDIIMVGEIRDRDTAEMATRAALVGRLLLSTLHTNDATGAIPRLLDMGVEPYLVSSTLALVIGQRLVRKICVACRESIVMPASQLEILRSCEDFANSLQILQAENVLSAEADLAQLRVYRGRGCGQCLGSGYRGRFGLFELFELDDELRSLVMQRPSAAAVRALAIRKGLRTLYQDGLAKVFLGETTLEEVLRAAV